MRTSERARADGGSRKPDQGEARRIPVVPVIAALTVPLVVYLYTSHRPLFQRLTAEDAAFEYATAVAYLLAAIALGALAAFRHRLNIWLWGLALMFFVVAGEEVSWGQRLFGMETPAALRESNVQNEFNLHNLQGVHGVVRAASLVVLLGLFVVLPFLMRLAPLRKLAQRWNVPVPPAWSTVIAVIATAFMAVPRLQGEVVFALDEAGELYFGVLALWFAVVVVRRGVGPSTAWYPADKGRT